MQTNWRVFNPAIWDNDGAWMSTRLSGVASALRATYYKQSERNLLKNIDEAIGYEGVVEGVRTSD